MQTVLHEAIAARVFPGASVHFERGAQTVTAVAGALTYDAGAPPVTPDTLYDLASLTKLWTLSAFLLAAREANVDVETSLHRFFPLFDASDKRAITLRHLMQHNAGIELGIQALCDVPVESWAQRAAQAPLHSAPGERVLYCCTNFWLLARVTEHLAGTTLDALLEERLVRPLGLERSTFTPLERFALSEIAPTEVDASSGKAWHGIVHDEAARAWQRATGTCCGNSGLFGTARDAARFARMWLREGEGILHPEDVRRALRDTTPEGGAATTGITLRAWGWQRNNRSFAPPGAWGHAGFTGPTLWIGEDALGVVLNNRVHPTREGPPRTIYHRRLNDAFLAAKPA